MPPRMRSIVLWLSLMTFIIGFAPVAGQSLDCAGYDSQIWAQSVFETDPNWFASLDPDGNGLACDDLPPGAAPAWWTSRVPPGSQPVTLLGVTDGDTIRVVVNGRNEPVRLILIDAPETRDPNNPPECFGQEATVYLSWLLSLGGDLYLERDLIDRDRFDRLLRYLWLDFGGGEVYLVNEVMARSGYAAQSTFPPDVNYEEEIREAARFAREHGYGLWSGCLTDEDGDTNELELSGTQGIVSAPVEPAPAPVPERDIIADPVEAFGCDPSYPDICIPPSPPDLDCGDIGVRHFAVYQPDPHRFDGDFDGIGCER